MEAVEPSLTTLTPPSGCVYEVGTMSRSEVVAAADVRSPGPKFKLSEAA